MENTVAGRKVMQPIAFSLLVVSIVGCSEGNVFPVSGKIIFADGSPVDTGIIEFRHNTEHINARAKIEKDGKFKLSTFEEFDGAVVGNHKAIIVQHIMAEVEAPTERHDNQGHAAASKHLNHRRVDKKFSSYDTSPLEFQVESDQENDFVVEVF